MFILDIYINEHTSLVQGGKLHIYCHKSPQTVTKAQGEIWVPTALCLGPSERCWPVQEEVFLQTSLCRPGALQATSLLNKNPGRGIQSLSSSLVLDQPCYNHHLGKNWKASFPGSLPDVHTTPICLLAKTEACSIVSDSFATSRTVVACQAPLFMRLSQQEYWSEKKKKKNTGVVCHFLLQGIFPTRDRTCVSRMSYIAERCFYHLATNEAPKTDDHSITVLSNLTWIIHVPSLPWNCCLRLTILLLHSKYWAMFYTMFIIHLGLNTRQGTSIHTMNTY